MTLLGMFTGGVSGGWRMGGGWIQRTGRGWEDVSTRGGACFSWCREPPSPHLDPDRRRPGHLVVDLDHPDVVVAFAGLHLRVLKRERELPREGVGRVDERVVLHDVDLPDRVGPEHLDRKLEVARRL